MLGVWLVGEPYDEPETRHENVCGEGSPGIRGNGKMARESSYGTRHTFSLY